VPTHEGRGTHPLETWGVREPINLLAPPRQATRPDRGLHTFCRRHLASREEEFGAVLPLPRFGRRGDPREQLGPQPRHRGSRPRLIIAVPALPQGFSDTAPPMPSQPASGVTHCVQRDTIYHPIVYSTPVNCRNCHIFLVTVRGAGCTEFRCWTVLPQSTGYHPRGPSHHQTPP